MSGTGLTQADITKGINKAVETAKRVTLRDTGKTPGLQLLISPKGTATWSLLYRQNKGEREKRYKLGRFGPRFGIAKARDEVALLRAEINRGNDPILERQASLNQQREADRAAKEAEAERKAAEARLVTVNKLFELYCAARANDSGMAKNKRIIEFSVLPVVGDIAVTSLRKSDVQRVVDQVRARGNSTQCRRVLEAFRAMLIWALDRDYLLPEQQNIWRKLSLPEKPVARRRVLTAHEIKWLWDQCNQRWADLPNIARIVRLDILLGQRSSETCQIETGDVSEDLFMWTIPGKRTKNGEPHAVPLPPLARQIMSEAIADAPDKRVFVGERGKTVRNDRIAHALQDAISEWNELHPDDQIEHFVVHDLRRTVATRLEEAGTPSTVIETLLNHISGKAGSVTRKHYAHGDISLAVRHALAKWGALVQQCVDGEDPFATRAEDIEAIERRAEAEINGGRPKLNIVG